MKALRTLAISATALALGLSAPVAAQERTEFRVAWSIYVGWMPWGYLEESGIMDKWADKYGIDVEIVQINDYVESINQYTAGAFDGVSATNMDTLSIPSGGGVDTTALIVGDFSNGNDEFPAVEGVTLADNVAALGEFKADEVNLSEVAKNILNDWSSAKGSFVKVFPYEYQRALKEMEEKAEDTCAKKKEEAEEEEPEVADIESVVKDADMIKRKAEIVLDKTRGFVKYK